jgi:hypothetical protein
VIGAPHFHAVFLDGILTRDALGAVRFHPAPAPEPRGAPRDRDACPQAMRRLAASPRLP